MTRACGLTIEATAALLKRVFPDASRIGEPPYLRWLYKESPFGAVIQANLDDDAGRAGHYALVPIGLTADGTAFAGALSLNTAVDERARGGGVFVRLATEAIETGHQQGVRMVIGVANANSTPGFLRRLSFELVSPLPATVLIPLPGGRRSVRSMRASDAAFTSGGIAADGLDQLLSPPKQGLARTWTLDTLRWRLASPGAHYALHRSEHMLVVSTVDRSKGVPVAVLLKAFTSSSPSAAERRAIVRAACRFHKAPIAIHVGINDAVGFNGVPFPKRLQASPLNLIVRRLDDSSQPTNVARFEFLDFDAY